MNRPASSQQGRAPSEAVEPPVKPQEHAVDEAIARYYGEWILMQVTEHDEHAMPARGHVLAHSAHRRDISQALTKEPARSERSSDASHQPYYIFKAYPRAHVGETFEQAVERFATQRAAVDDLRT